MGKKWTKEEKAAKLVAHAIGASGFICTTLTLLENGLSVTEVSLVAFAILFEREVNARQVRRLKRPYLLPDQTPVIASLAAQLRHHSHIVTAHFYAKGSNKVQSATVAAKDPGRMEYLKRTRKLTNLQDVLKRVEEDQILFYGRPEV